MHGKKEKEEGNGKEKEENESKRRADSLKRITVWVSCEDSEVSSAIQKIRRALADAGLNAAISPEVETMAREDPK